MRFIKTEDLKPNSLRSATEQLHVYNALDTMVTLEVFENIVGQLDNQTAATYAFSRELQAPVLEMSMRGVRIDLEERSRLIGAFARQLDVMEHNLNLLLREGVGTELNWRSPQQLQTLFYEVLGLPPVRKHGKITTDRDALESLSSYFFAGPIVAHILAMRDLAKKISTLKTGVDPDGRMRTSYNIAGTNTGRFSSSFNIFGAGGNFQNWEDRLRRIFIADPGMKFAYIDLEQAESRLVGAIEWNLFHDGRYLDACESGDLHTSVCRLAWADLPWNGDLSLDKKVAEAPFYRQHSYRHMAKVLGHGTNYNGQPYTMAKHTKLASGIIKEFQAKYFEAFPAHKRWHEHVANTVRRDGHLVNLMGRRRWFFGRRDDPATVREAIAFDPQGSVGDILNRGMLQVWRLRLGELLMQIHDAILVQYPEELEDEIVPRLLDAIRVPIELRHGRTLEIPSEAQVGWNWAKWCCGSGQCKTCPSKGVGNPDGLIKYKPGESRRRTFDPAASLLDRRVSGLHG